MQDDTVGTGRPALRRRDLMKLGAGAVMTALSAKRVSAQRPAPGSPRPPGELRPHTGPGYKNDYNRASGNGPMDDTSRKIVSWVHTFSEKDLTPPLVHALNRTMVDTMAALIAGFEEPSVRIAAQMARYATPVMLKSTVLGYGLTTTPELASFANTSMVRHCDFNDSGPFSHNSDLISAALAIGEALHSTGAEVMQAITISYELKGPNTGGEPAGAAMAAGKLMKLNEDQLANALTLAITPHVALNKGVGAMSMWKGCRSAEAMKCGVWAALLAREGMTGPPQPFEGRGGLWSVFGKGREVKLPYHPLTVVERMGFKTYPSEGSSQWPIHIVPQMRAWTKVEEIASIQYDMPYSTWQEIGSNPKWDPRNRETADHSMPYMLARALIDGYIYLDSYAPEKYPNVDPVCRDLMAKMTLGPVAGWEGGGVARITIRKKTGEEKSFDTYEGVRTIIRDDPNGGVDKTYPAMTDADIAEKFNRVCAYKKVTDAQRDRARTVWGNLLTVKDIGEAIQALAKFGQPKPL